MREAMETALQDRTAAPAELTVTWEEVCRYLDSLAARGRRRETIQVYRPKLEAFYHFLPEDKRVAADTLELWRAALLREGYSPGTANTHVSANGLLAYLGRRDLQLIGQLDTEGEIQPELSRTEYLRLLATARNLGRERTYLMVKVFALTGIRVSELNRVTVRAVEEGRVLTACDGRAQYVLIPACLRKELTVYLRRVGITAGPVFVTRSGRPMRRTQVSGEIRTLCRDARVDGDKSSPRCLRRLYQVRGYAVSRQESPGAGAAPTGKVSEEGRPAAGQRAAGTGTVSDPGACDLRRYGGDGDKLVCRRGI